MIHKEEWPKVSIIVVNYNGLSSLGGLLGECLKSLLSTDYPNFEVIFVDNASLDGSADYVKQSFNDHRIRILRLNKNYMYAGGLNKGIEVADKTSKYLVFMNNDVVVCPNWLKELVKVMEQDEKIGIASPKVLNFDGSLQLEDLLIDRFLFSYAIKIPVNKVFLVSRPHGPAYVIRKSLIKGRGLFDKKLVIYREEAYVGHVTWMKGFKVVYVPTAVIYHRLSATINKYSLPTFRFHLYKNDLYLLLKFGSVYSILCGFFLRLMRLPILAVGCAIKLKGAEPIIDYFLGYTIAFYWLVKNNKFIIRYKGKPMFYLPSKYSLLRTVYPSLCERLLLKFLRNVVDTQQI